MLVLILPVCAVAYLIGRAVVLSKAMKVVDEETRRQVKDARLDALEADNYTGETVRREPFVHTSEREWPN